MSRALYSTRKIRRSAFRVQPEPKACDSPTRSPLPSEGRGRMTGYIETDAPQRETLMFHFASNMTASFMESAFDNSNRKLFAYFRRHADWPAGLRVYRDTRVFERMIIAGHRCSFGFQ